MKIREYRKKIEKTQRQCAKELEITVVYFSDLERGVFEPSKKLSKRIINWSDGAIRLVDLWAAF